MRTALNSLLFGKHLEEDEVVSTIVHAHWMIGLKMMAIPGLSLAFSASFFILSAVRETTQTIVLILAVWLTVSIVWFLRSFFDYYLDALIITDKGVIDLEWHGWLHRESSKVLYSDIQGVSYEIKGIAGTMFRFGTVSVEKISTGAAISIPFVPHPQALESLILRNMEAYLHTKNMKDSRHVQEILAGLVAQNTQLTGLPAKKPAADTPQEPKKKKSFEPRRL